MAVGRVLVAFDDAWNVASPTWTRLDSNTATPGYRVQGFQIDRARQSEFDKTSTGEASVTIVDTAGAFDPTYASGTYYGKMDSMLQVMLQRYNPVTDTWHPRFRGFISRWRYQLHPSEKALFVTIECKDFLGVLAAAELMTGQHGDTPPAISEGNVYYQQADQVEDRINAILTDVGFPLGMREVFSGNVILQPTVYSSRGQFLAAIDDACDGEFPGVANRFIRCDGYFVFHGRLARFHPDDVQYDITTWKAGDDAAVIADSNRVPIAGGRDDPAFEFWRDENDIVNAVYSAPKGIAEADIAGQYVTDATSKAKFGPHSLSFEELITSAGYLPTPDSTANEETLSFGQYYIDNYADQKTRLPQLSFSMKDDDDARAAKTWALLCGIDISDIVNLKTTHAWGGGFDQVDFYVEGCHERQSPLSGDVDDVRLTVDLSPRAFFDTNPFEAV